MSQNKVEKSENTMVYGKSISINVLEEGVLEGNVIQIPFLAEYRPKNTPITSINYVWTTTSKIDDSKVKRGIEVSGHGRLGVPTLKEKEVLRGLTNLFVEQHTEDGVCKLKHPDDCTDKDYEITFTMRGLCRELGYIGNPSSNTLNGIKDSLKILVSTTIFNRENGGLYDPEKKEYILDKDIAFHLIEQIEGRTITDREGKIVADVTKIRLGSFVYKSLYNNYRLIYNKSHVNSIKHRGAKTLYQLALQWSNKGLAYAKIDKLTEHIPMRDGISIVQKRDYIKRCLNRLNETDFVKVKIDKNNVVHFKFRDEILKATPNKATDDMFVTYSQTLDGVMQLGYTKSYATQFIDEHITKISDVQKALRQTHALMQQDPELDDRLTFLQLFYEEDGEDEQVTLWQ